MADVERATSSQVAEAQTERGETAVNWLRVTGANIRQHRACVAGN